LSNNSAAAAAAAAAPAPAAEVLQCILNDESRTPPRATTTNKQIIL